MSELKKHTVSLTKFGYLHISDLLRKHEIDQVLEKSNIDNAQLLKMLGGNNSELPKVWNDVKSDDVNLIEPLVWLSIILSHHKLIELFSQSSSSTGNITRDDLGSKGFTNLRGFMSNTKFDFHIKQNNDDFYYDLSSFSKTPNLFSYAKEVIENQLINIGWNNSIQKTDFKRDFWEQCFFYKFPSIFGLSNNEFKNWLEGRSEKEIYIKPYKKYTQEDSEEFNTLLATSLLAKPFAILTGASGTGKTKQAKDLAKHFSKDTEGSNYEVVAVGADWTDNRATLGFVNYLTHEEYPIYQSTPIVNLLLRASKDLNTPYFLILDEMNLSHVERYFADFLSVMEQKDGMLQLHSEGNPLQNSAIEQDLVPAELDYPTNLFVIGTVNIDETTYMFSPKVLDRANVIEYKVKKNELGEFLLDPQEPGEIAPAGAEQAEQFLALARVIRGEESSEIVKTLEENQLDAVQKDVLSLFELMQARRFEFAFRTANEVSRYLKVSRHLSADQAAWDEGGWRVSLDEQILQKVLPKLHGSIGRVGKLIAQLAHFAYSPESSKYNEMLSDVSGLGSKDDAPRPVFPQSLAKLKEMAETLREEQFVSFI